MKYTKEQITEAIAYWKKILENLNEAEGDIVIPNSEWDKMSKYIQKGSDFKKVGAACRSNELKQKCRYLILKALGLDDAADDFMKGLSKYLDYGRQRELEALQADGVEVPGKYQELAVGKDEMQKQYAANKLRFDKAHAAGPLKALAQMGIDYFTLFSDGSGHPQLKEKAKKYFPEGVPTYKPSYGWVGNSGLRWDADMIVIMENGKLKGTGKKYFGFVAHTLESDAPNPGYSVFSYNGGGTVFADSMCNSVAECMKWIQENVQKVEGIPESSQDDNYTKEQITEAIAYWKKQLKTMNESLESSDLNVSNVSLVDILENVCYYQFAIDVTLGTRSATASSPSVIFSEEASQKIDSLVKSDEHSSIKRYFVAGSVVQSREEYNSEEESYDYDSFIADCIYEEEKRIQKYPSFKPSAIVPFEGCSFDGKPKTLIVALYAFN